MCRLRGARGFAIATCWRAMIRALSSTTSATSRTLCGTRDFSDVTSRDKGEAPFGVLLHRQLKLIHQMLRSDLEVCRRLADEVAAGAPAAAVAGQIVALQTRSPIWTLQVNCLYHCRVVHAHHGHEDA